MDYSDSEDETAADDAAAPAAAASSSTLSTTTQATAHFPPAKKQRKEINLQALLAKHDAALPFDEATGKLPADFFDAAPPSREADLGEVGGQAQPAARGWAALSAMLPAPKNKLKSGKGSSSSLYLNAKPLHRPSGCAIDASVSSASASAIRGLADAPPPKVAAGCGGMAVGEAADAAAASVEAPPSHHGLGVPGQGGTPMTLAAPSATASLLVPRIRHEMYSCATDASASGGKIDGPTCGRAEPSSEEVMGPTLGPAPPPPSAAGGYEAGGMEPPPYEISDSDRVVEVSQADLRKAMGPAKQYDFAVPPPKEEVKIAANFWSRASGTVEQQYKPSSLQKRKHQINSLAADAAARASEIAARGSKGMKSKRETAAKYGW